MGYKFHHELPAFDAALCIVCIPTPIFHGVFLGVGDYNSDRGLILSSFLVRIIQLVSSKVRVLSENQHKGKSLRSQLGIAAITEYMFLTRGGLYVGLIYVVDR